MSEEISCFGTTGLNAAQDAENDCRSCPVEDKCKAVVAADEKALGIKKATRHNDGKPKMSLILEAREAMVGASLALQIGVANHGRGNYLAGDGLPQTEVADSLIRHLSAFLSGEDLDPETHLPHVDFILCNAMFLSQLAKTRPASDDRTNYSSLS